MILEESQKVKINQTMLKIYNDLCEIHKKLNKGALLVPIEYDFSEDDWELCVDKNYIRLYGRNTGETYTIGSPDAGYFSSRADSDFEHDIHFINTYPENRRRVIESVEKQLRKKQISNDQLNSSIDKIDRILNTDVIVDMNLGDSMNRHEIEVKKEDGRTIGIIDVGGKTVKIVTDGNIVLVSRDELKSNYQKKK